MKWPYIFLICFAAMVMIPMSILEYQKSQCRIESIKAGIGADKIEKLCNK